MKLKSLVATNILSYNKLTLDFEQGLFLVNGYNADENTANGSGKSAIVDIICWSLYGEMPRSPKADEVIKWDSTIGCRTIIEWEKAGVTHSITRSRKPNDLVYIVNNNIMVAKDSKELQSKITKNIGISLNTFLHSVYFPQDSNKADEFLFANDMSKKEILTELLGLEIFDRCLEKTKSSLKEADFDLTRLSATEKAKVAEKSNALARGEEYKKFSAEFEQTKNNDLKLLESNKTDIANRVKDAKKIFAAYTEPQSLIDANTNKIKDNEAKITKLIDHDQSIALSINSLTNTVQSFTHGINEAEKAISRMRSLGLQCDKCEQLVKSTDIQAKISDRGAEKLDLEAKILATEAEKKVLHEKVDKIATKVRSLQDENSKLTDDSRDLRNSYNNAKDKYDNVIGDAKIALAALNQQIEQTRLRDNKYEVLVNNSFNEVNCLSNEIKELQTTIAALSLDVKVYTELTIAFGRSGIRNLVFQNAIAELEKYVNDYLVQLFVGDVKIEFRNNTTKQTIETAFNLYGREVNVNLLSGGQKRRLVLATNFALTKLIGNRFSQIPNFTILDECFNGLDVAGKQQVMEFLRGLSATKDFVWVIDHTTEFAGAFDNVYSVVLKDGASVLTNGQMESYEEKVA